VLIPRAEPTQDTGQLQVRIETAQSVSYARMAELRQAAREILQDPDVDTLSSFIGVDAASNTMLHTEPHAGVQTNAPAASRNHGPPGDAPARCLGDMHVNRRRT
jgi:multidrug efflux pump subunit AcrB